MSTAIPRINIDVTSDDQSDSDLVARLIVATLNTHGFEDVTNVTTPTHVDKEEEVVEAMQNLNPSIFSAEVVVEASVFEESAAIAGSADEVPGEEFPDPAQEEDEELSNDD